MVWRPVVWVLGASVGFAVGVIGTFILLDIAAGFVSEDPEALQERNDVFAVSLVAAFAAAGALMGLVQFAVQRSVGRIWVAQLAVAFGVVAAGYLAITAWLGESHLDEAGPRFFNEVVHNAVGGVVLGLWSYQTANLAIPRGAWIGWLGLAFVAGGLFAWGIESAAGMASGDAGVFGILGFGLLTYVAWRKASVQA